MRMLLIVAALLAGTACSRSQPLTTLTPETRRAMGVAQLFARKLGMAADCRSPGPDAHYSIRDAADSWIVQVEPPPRPGPTLLVTVGKRDYKVIRARKVT